MVTLIYVFFSDSNGLWDIFVPGRFVVEILMIPFHSLNLLTLLAH